MSIKNTNTQDSKKKSQLNISWRATSENNKFSMQNAYNWWDGNSG